MKKLLFILLLLPLLSSAQFKQGVGFEYYQINKYQTYSPNTDRYQSFDKGDFAILYKLQYKLNNLKAEALTSIYMNKEKEDWTFAPTHSEFTLSVSYTVDKLKFKASHQCVHPLMSDSDKRRIRLTGSNTNVGVYYNFD